VRITAIAPTRAIASQSVVIGVSMMVVAVGTHQERALGDPHHLVADRRIGGLGLHDAVHAHEVWQTQRPLEWDLGAMPDATRAVDQGAIDGRGVADEHRPFEQRSV
jgi:hypothetical protein